MIGHWLATVLCLAAAAGEPGGGESPPPIRFRRVYVPAANREGWPLGRQKYLPVVPDEFERLLAASAGPAAEADQPALAPRVVHAEYEARLEDDRWLEGRATLRVEHVSEARTLLRLTPCGLAIRHAVWSGEEPRPAALGLGVDGGLDVLVEQSGLLEFEWSLAGRRDAAGVLVFPLRLPASPVNRLLLDTPDDLEITADPGAVLDRGRNGDGARRWQIELGNRSEFSLRAAPPGTGAAREGLALVREQTGYDVSLRGVEVTTEWNLEIHHEPVRQIGFQLDEALQLVTATLDEEPVPWTVTPGEAGQPSRGVLRLPEPIQGTGLVLRLGALAPHVGDRPWRMPRIRPEGLFWQEGGATLSVRAPWVVERLTLIGCRQTGAEALAAPREGEAFHLQFFQPDATAELSIVESPHRVEAVTGTSVRWGEDEVRARVRADFRLEAGGRFQLVGALGERWMVDAVESTPSDAIDQWAVEPDDQGGRRLVVRLARPLAPGRPIRLSVATRRLGASLEQPLEIDELAPLAFQGVASSRNLVGLRTPDVYELEYLGASPTPAIALDALPPSKAELLDDDDSMAVFQLGGAGRNPQVRLKPRRPRFLAEIGVEARVAEGVLQEVYRIRCEPESAPLDRLVVRMSRWRDEPLEWAAAGEETVRVSARRWAPEEQLASGLSGEGEAWELRLNPPVSEALEITARRESSHTGGVHPSLASVPDAGVQTGVLAVHAAPGAAIEIQNRRLRQMPPEPFPHDRYTTARAVYRYDPWRETGRVGEPPVTILSRPAEQAAMASVWEARLDSRYETGGTGCHTVVFHVENLGQSVLRIRLPTELRGDGRVEVRVDGQPVTATGVRTGAMPDAGWPDAGSSGPVRPPEHALHVPLPPGRKYPTITLVFTSKERRLLPVGTLRAPWPEPDVPVLNRSWTVWLPPGYSTYGGQDALTPLSPPKRHWSERLLGRLGRGAGQTAFHPLAPDHWLALLGDGGERREAVRRVEAWLEQAAASQTAPELGETRDPPFRLGDLLTHPSVHGLNRTLLVDREALARYAISPEDAIAALGADSPPPTARQLLARSGLALLIGRETALLTSQTDAARLRPHLDATALAHLWWIPSRPLARRLAQAAQNEGDAAFLPAGAWVARPGSSTNLWRYDGPPGHESADLFGWQAVSPRVEKDVAAVRYYHGHSAQLAGSLAFLLAVTGGWWLARQRAMALLAAACAAGLIGLWVPDPYIPAASGVVLGSLFCLTFRLVHRHLAPHSRPRRPAESVTPPSTVSATVPWSLVLLVATAVTGWCATVYGGYRNSEPGLPMYRMFIPVDEDREPVGGKYYLPEPLFAELHRRAAARRDLPQGWLLGEATYRGELVREPAGERFRVDQIRAQFDLHVFSPSAQVHIPLDRSSANLLPDGALLDDRVAQVEWSVDNRALVLEVAEPGQYQVELRMRPRMQADPPAGFDLSIPPLPMGQLKLTLPPGAPSVEVPTARGMVRREDSPSRLVAELGPSDVLSVRWPSGSGPSGGGPAIDIEELLWMRVRPGSVLVDVKWKLTPVEGRIRRLRLATDPRLRLLPLEGDRSPAVRTLAGDSELLQIVFEWPEPLRDETRISARFLLTGTSGVGNLRPPQLDLLDGRTTRRWMAVSVADALQFERSGVERLSPVPLPEFLSAWGDAESAPNFAYRLLPEPPHWTLATQPREPKTSAEKQLTLRFAEHVTGVEMEAALETASGYAFHYRIAAPESLEVTRVALMSDGVDRATRWSQDEQGAINLFLASPVSGTQQLVVRGRLPGALGQTLAVPDFRIEGARSVGTTLRVMRRSGVLVEVHGAGAQRPTDAPAAETEKPVDWLPVGSYRMAPGAQQDITIAATANEPTLTGMEIVRLSADDGVWHARWECRLEISDGLLEELSLDAPAAWGNRFRSSEGVRWSLGAMKEGRQEVSIRPKQPVKDRWWAWVSGRLPLAPGESVAVPDIAMRGSDAVARFVILPRRIDGRAMDWQVQGLERVPLAEVAPELAPEHGALAAFRIMSKPFSAELPEVPAPWDAGRVHLAEYALAWQEGGRAVGAVWFDVEPGTQPTCEILLPENSRPVLVQVDGVPAPLADPPDAGRLKVQLGPPGIPQRVEAVFEVDLPRPVGGSLELAVPRIAQLPVERTLWTFAAPPRRIARTSQADQATSTGQIALARLEHHSVLIDRYITAAGDDSPDTTRWYRRWLRYWAAAHEAARTEISRLREETERRRARERIDELTQQQRQTAARLDADDALGELLEAGAGTRGLSGPWRAALFQGRSVVGHQVVGGRSEISVDVTPLPATAVLDRLLATAGWAAVLGLWALGLHWGLLKEAFRRWPQALGALAGLAWWVWLSPSALGLLLVTASVATSVRAGWRSLSPPGSDTGIVSVRTSHMHATQWNAGNPR